MTTTYLAIPLLVYVPLNHPFAARGQEYIGDSLADHLRLISGILPLLAEDFQDAEVTHDEDNELSAILSDVCRVEEITHPPTNPGFDPGFEWPSALDAAKHCFAQPRPIQALTDVVAFHLHLDQMKFAVEVIQAFPNGPFPAKPPLITGEGPASSEGLDSRFVHLAARNPSHLEETMVDAVDLLSGNFIHSLHATYQHPGVICLDHENIRFTFGYANGPFGFDFSLDPDNRDVTEAGEATLAGDVSDTVLADWIYAQVFATCEKYPAPPSDAHLNAIIQLPTDAETLIPAGRADFLSCYPDKDNSYLLIYEENMPDSTRLREFAKTYRLKLVYTDPSGKEYSAARANTQPVQQPPASPTTMQAPEKLALVFEITERIKNEFAELLRRHRIPAEWTEKDIRNWLANKFEAERTV